MTDEQQEKIKGIGQQYAEALDDLTIRLSEAEATVASLQESVNLLEAENGRLVERNRKLDESRRLLLRDRDMLYRGSQNAYQALKETYKHLMLPPTPEENAQTEERDQQMTEDRNQQTGAAHLRVVDAAGLERAISG